MMAIVREIEPPILTLFPPANSVPIDAIPRISRVAHRTSIKLPRFARDPPRLQRSVVQMAMINGVIDRAKAEKLKAQIVGGEEEMVGLERGRVWKRGVEGGGEREKGIERKLREREKGRKKERMNE